MNKNILMLCYYYPPLTDVGSKRSVAFSKYLKEHGWTPHVLSVRNPDRTYCSVGNDRPPQGIHTEYSYSVINLYKVLGKLNGALTRALGLFNIRLTRNYLYDLLCIPDFFWGWIPLTTVKAVRLIRKFRIGTIYVSCTPFSSALTGVILKYLTGKPLILDFRDPYALETVKLRTRMPRFRSRIDRRLEEKLLRHADLFIVTTDEIRKGYMRQYPHIADRIFAIHNGFESAYASGERARKYAKFTIAYTGDFYFHALESRSFFQALALLKSRGKISGNTFQFLFYGEGKDIIRGIAENCGVGDLVTASLRIPYREALDVISRSHLQLLRIFKPMISTKLFEGIPLNTPFLATISSGEVEAIIRRYSPGSFIVTEESPEEIAASILEAMARYANGGIPDNHIREFLARFSRESLTLELIRIMEAHLGPGGTCPARQRRHI
ncbi:MAG TPA: glycosyltransferase [Dissulfurispiraceae bacterium]